MEDIYKRIKSLRQANKMTQSELAEKVGYADKTMVSRVENGKIDLSQSQIVKFAKALNTTPGFLMGWKEDISPEDLIPIASNEDRTSFIPTDEEIELLKKLRLLDNSFKKAIRASIDSAYEDYMEEKRAYSVS